MKLSNIINVISGLGIFAFLFGFVIYSIIPLLQLDSGVVIRRLFYAFGVILFSLGSFFLLSKKVRISVEALVRSLTVIQNRFSGTLGSFPQESLLSNRFTSLKSRIIALIITFLGLGILVYIYRIGEF